MNNWNAAKPRAELLNSQDFDEALNLEAKLKERVTEILYEAHLRADQILEQVDDEKHQKLKEIEESTSKFNASALRDQQAEAFAEMLSVSADIKAEFESMTPWLIDLLATCLQRLVGELEDAELTSRLIHEALKATGAKYGQALLVHPDEKARLLSTMSTYPNRFEGVTSLETCAEIEPGTIQIACDTSLCNVSLAAQFEALISVIKRAPVKTMGAA